MSNAPHILVVDDEPDIRHLLQEILQDEGYSVAIAENAAGARLARQAQRPDLILLDIWMPDVDGITLLKEWSEKEPLTQPVIIMSGHGTVETAVEATRLGAYDYIEKPLSLAKLLLTVEHALEHYNLQRENTALRQVIQPLAEPIGRSQKMQKLRQQALQIAQHDTPVLMLGDSGSGRQLFARYLHHNSSRRDRPFHHVDLTLLGEQQEGSLFGHHASDKTQAGELDHVQGGTLYIDDIAELNMSSQQGLVELLQQGTFRRLEGAQVTADLRLIAASSQVLDERVAQGAFREDLYYLLNAITLTIPPLREHNEDVLDLVSYYCDYYIETDKLPYRSFTTAALNRLRQYDWPGNVRELKNMVQRLLIIGQQRQIEQIEVEEVLASQPRPVSCDNSTLFEQPLRQAREQFEHAYFENLLRRYQGSVHKVAQHAEVERTHLYRKLRSLALDTKDYM